MKTKLFVDAAANRLEKIVNNYGKKNSWTDGYRAAVVSESGLIKESFVNRKASNSLMAEAWAVLKGVEVARDFKLLDVTIVSDAIGGFDHPAHDGETYLQIAKNMAAENGISVDFEFVPGTTNPADELSRKVTVIEAAQAAAGTIDDLIVKSAAFGTQKTKLRKLAANDLEKAWAIWNELNAPDFRIDGKQVSRSKFVPMLIEKLGGAQ